MSCFKLIKGKKINLADTSEKKMFRIRVFGTDYLSVSATSYLSRFIMTNPPVREENSEGKMMIVVLELLISVTVW